MTKKLMLMLLCSTFIVQACTSRKVYDSMKARNEVECRKVPTSEYEDCMRSLDGDYDRYREQREDVIQNSH